MKKILLIAFIGLSMRVNAQNYVPDITERYWNYRYHLIGDDIDPSYWEAGLLQMGNCDGCSLPATQAVMSSCGNDAWIFQFPRASNDFNIGACANQSFTYPNGNPIGEFPLFIGEYIGTNRDKDGLIRWEDTEISLGKYLIVLASEYVLLSDNGYAVG